MLVLVPRVLSVRVRFTAVKMRTLSKKGMVVKKAWWSSFAVVVVYRAVFISSYTHTVCSHEQSSPVATETLSHRKKNRVPDLGFYPINLGICSIKCIHCCLRHFEYV